MTNFQIFASIATGLITGVISGLFGVGGGVIIVPALIFLFGFTQITATATSLVAMLLPVGILGVLQYYNTGKLTSYEIKAGLLIALGLFIGVYFGAKIAIGLPPHVLKKSFAVFIVFVAARLWWS